jgi:hypothetical protein
MGIVDSEFLQMCFTGSSIKFGKNHKSQTCYLQESENNEKMLFLYTTPVFRLAGKFTGKFIFFRFLSVSNMGEADKIT